MEVYKKDGNGVTSKIIDGIKNIFNKNDGKEDGKRTGNGLLGRKQKVLNNPLENIAKAQSEKQESSYDNSSNIFNESIKVHNTNGEVEKNARENMDRNANSQHNGMSIDDPDQVQV